MESPRIFSFSREMRKDTINAEQRSNNTIGTTKQTRLDDDASRQVCANLDHLGIHAKVVATLVEQCKVRGTKLSRQGPQNPQRKTK